VFGVSNDVLSNGTWSGRRSHMHDWSPLERDVLLKGTLTVIVSDADGKPCPRRRVTIRGCGFV